MQHAYQLWNSFERSRRLLSPRRSVTVLEPLRLVALVVAALSTGKLGGTVPHLARPPWLRSAPSAASPSRELSWPDGARSLAHSFSFFSPVQLWGFVQERSGEVLKGSYSPAS